MGNVSSDEDPSNPRSFGDFNFDEEKMVFINELDDSHYGECKIYSQPGLEHRICVVKSNIQHDEEGDLCDLRDQSTKMINIDHESIIKLFRFSINRSSMLCSALWGISHYYEYTDNDLEIEMRQRKVSKQYYEESELWHIVISVVAALAYLQSHSIEHGNIQPSMILINDQGKVKVFSKPISQQIKCAQQYVQSIFDDKKTKYLSPILLASLKKKTPFPKHDSGKSDLYSLGLIIVEAATLCDSNQFYDANTFSINSSNLSYYLREISEQYSSQLYEFVQQLLTVEEKSRPDCDDLFLYIEELSRQGVLMADRIFTHPSIDPKLINLSSHTQSSFKPFKRISTKKFYSTPKDKQIQMNSYHRTQSSGALMQNKFALNNNNQNSSNQLKHYHQSFLHEHSPSLNMSSHFKKVDNHQAFLSMMSYPKSPQIPSVAPKNYFHHQIL